MIDTHIEDLIKIWFLFNLCNAKSADTEQSDAYRSKNAVLCEELMRMRYEVINDIDDEIEKYMENHE